jgi:hypothetical protein
MNNLNPIKHFTLFVFFSLLIIACRSNIDKTVEEYNVIINEIDTFISINSKSPSEDEFYKIISKLSYKTDEECPCYKKESESEYILWFGLELGESMVYNSKTKKWERKS